MNVEGTLPLNSKDSGTDAKHCMLKKMDKRHGKQVVMMQGRTITSETWFRGLYLLAVLTKLN